MPTLKYNEDLNTLNKAKRIVNSNLRRNFKGTEISGDSGTSAKVADLYDAFLKLLVEYKVALNELDTTFDLTQRDYEKLLRDIYNLPAPVGRPRQPVANPDLTAKIADRFVGTSTRIALLTEELANFIRVKLSTSLSKFSPPQVAELNYQMNAIKSLFNTMLDNIDSLEGTLPTGETIDTASKLAFQDIIAKWQVPATKLMTTFDNLMANYSQGASQNQYLEPVVKLGSGYHNPSDSDEEPVYTVGKGMQMPTRYL
jgi:hypothetical protein